LNSSLFYNSNNTGRFLSPDPGGLFYADPTNPQSFNLYSYAQNNPLTNTDPTGLDCVYFNNAGDGVESVDRSSNSGECGSNGGDWVNGTVQSATYFASSDTFGFRSSDSQNNYLTYANAPGTESDGTTCSGNCDTANGYLQSSNGAPDLTDDQRTQLLVQGVAQNTGSLPWLCNAGLNARAAIPKTGLAVGGAVDLRGVHGSLNAQLSPLPGGASLNYTQTGSKGGLQVNVPIAGTPFRASAGISPGRFNLGASTAIPGTKNAVSAGATLSFGYLGDATCR
jgi:hypothetical protein